MLFNSIEFMVFLIVVLVCYWAIPTQRFRQQNVLLLIASYVFYGWWDVRFLSLIIISSTVDFLLAPAIERAQSRPQRRMLLGLSLSANLGMLATFKYYDFFVESFVESMALLGIEASVPRLRLILPVGISFYTFQTLSYTIDVYRGHLRSTRDSVAFFTFVSFFPQLVAGPIERASHLMPQFLEPRRFEYVKAIDGMRQILWGLVKKIVIADNCAQYADQVFGNYTAFSSGALIMAAVCFAMQIYGDFSGYSDIAIGVARLFGFGLMQNFAFPYFSRDIAEFWRRWHISLSTWFRDYVYLPLGGSRCSVGQMIRNTMIVFVLSGFWHGANWTFVVWGLINALYFLPLQLTGLNRRFTVGGDSRKTLFPSVTEAAQIIATFAMTVLAWVFFRSESLTQAFGFLSRVILAPEATSTWPAPGSLPILIGLFLLAEWLQRDRRHVLDLEEAGLPRWTRWLIYYCLITAMILFGGEQQDFIYFQF